MKPLEAAATLREFALLNIGPTLREAIAVAADAIEAAHQEPVVVFSVTPPEGL